MENPRIEEAVRDRVREIVGKILHDADVEKANLVRDIVDALALRHFLVPKVPLSDPFLDMQAVRGENYFTGEILEGHFDEVVGTEGNVQIIVGNSARLLRAGTVVAVEDVKPV